MSDRLASLEAALLRMDRERREQAKLVSEAIKRNFSKRNIDEDELLRDVEAVLAPHEDEAETDEHTPSVANTDQSPSPGPSSRDKGKEPMRQEPMRQESTRHDSPANPEEAPHPRTPTGMTPFDSEAMRFLQELRPILVDCRSTQVDRGKRLPQKGPELFDGSYANFRVWWEKLTDYFNINSPSLPNDMIKVQTVGTFMKGNAWSWYHARRRSTEAAGTPDTWKSLSEAIVERFTDRMEVQKDWERMCDLTYDGDIQTYLARLTEINTRVGATGEPFRDIIAQAIPTEMHRALYLRYETWPTNDHDLVEAVRKAGLLEEEILRSQAQKKKKNGKDKDKTGKSDKTEKTDKGSKGSGKGDTTRDTTRDRKKKFKSKPNPKKDFSHLTRVWSSTKDALKGISQSQIDKFKADGNSCWRCGDDRHMTYHCIRAKDRDGNELPDPPSDARTKIKKADHKKSTAGAKRKAKADSSDDESDSSDDEPKVKKPKKANAVKAEARESSSAVQTQARELQNIWADDSSDTGQSDF